MAKTISQYMTDIENNYFAAMKVAEKIDGIHTNIQGIFSKWRNEKRSVKVSLNPVEVGRSVGLMIRDNTTYIEAYPQLDSVITWVNAQFREWYNVTNIGLEREVETQIELARAGEAADDIGRVAASADIIYLRKEEMDDIQSYFDSIYLKIRELNTKLGKIRNGDDLRDVLSTMEWFKGKAKFIEENWMSLVSSWMKDNPMLVALGIFGTIWFVGSGTAENMWNSIFHSSKKAGKFALDTGVKAVSARYGL